MLTASQRESTEVPSLPYPAVVHTYPLHSQIAEHFFLAAMKQTRSMGVCDILPQEIEFERPNFRYRKT